MTPEMWLALVLGAMAGVIVVAVHAVIRDYLDRREQQRAVDEVNVADDD